MNKSISDIKRMEIYIAKLPLSGGSVQMGIRPVLIVGNDMCNMKSPNVIVVPITSKEKRWDWLHVEIPTSTGVEKESNVLCEQILTIPKDCLGKKVGSIEDNMLIKKIEHALSITLCIGVG